MFRALKRCQYHEQNPFYRQIAKQNICACKGTASFSTKHKLPPSEMKSAVQYPSPSITAATFPLSCILFSYLYTIKDQRHWCRNVLWVQVLHTTSQHILNVQLQRTAASNSLVLQPLPQHMFSQDSLADVLVQHWRPYVPREPVILFSVQKLGEFSEYTRSILSGGRTFIEAGRKEWP